MKDLAKIKKVTKNLLNAKGIASFFTYKRETPPRERGMKGGKMGGLEVL